jgi:hypothetical protein
MIGVRLLRASLRFVLRFVLRFIAASAFVSFIAFIQVHLSQVEEAWEPVPACPCRPTVL